MNILKSLIRTYFLDASINLFFQKMESSFDFYKNSESAVKIEIKDLKLGMRLSRIEERDFGDGYRDTYINCVITKIDIYNTWIYFDYERCIVRDPYSDDEFHSQDMLSVNTNHCEYYL